MKRYAFVGASQRGMKMFAVPLAQEFQDVAELVGIYDVNSQRAKTVRDWTGLNFPVYSGFEEMIAQAKPDTVIVTTIDRYHHEYIVKSLYAGCDVITEKPMTIDEEKCLAILNAERETGRKVTVTFNYRFSPFAARLKELLSSDIIGTPGNVHFEWILGRTHGSDYFRRWHRYKENSGGLLVHKATHHFDMINWLLNQEPVKVNAFGSLMYYGANKECPAERCLTCSKHCPMYLDITKDEQFNKLYLQNESVDGYYRDRCVFARDINIEDTMSVNVKYSGGAFLSYTLNAYAPYEAYKLYITGTNGRLEAEDYHSDDGVFGKKRIYKLRIYNRYGEEIVYNVGDGIFGGHGGGDPRLREMIFREGTPDPLGQQASSRAGAMSIITGIAANKSIKEDRAIYISELLGGFFD